MNYGRFALVTAAVALMVTGCNRRSDQEYYDALPTADGLTLELSGSTSEGTAKVDGLATTSNAVESTDELIVGARGGVRLVNGSVRYVLDTVHQIVENNEGEEGPTANTRVYGPFDRGNVTYRLGIRKFTRLAFAFKLEAKPLGADDSAYLVIFGGAVQKGTEPHMGRGIVGINLDNAVIVDETFPGTGKLLAGFARRPAGKALAFLARNYTPDTTEHDPISGAFVGWRRNSDNGTAIRVATKVDLSWVEGNTALKENLGVRARWIPGVGGRLGAIAAGGDIPDGTAYVAHACWDASEGEQFKAVRKCTGVGSGSPDCSTIIMARGDRTACSFQDDVLEPGSLDDTTMEEGAPVDDVISPPADVPSGESEL